MQENAMKDSPDAKAIPAATAAAARMDILIAELRTASPSRKETIGESLAAEMKTLRTFLP